MRRASKIRADNSKRLYLNKIRNHMKQISDEIANLTCRSSSNKLANASLESDRKIAKNRAKIYSEFEQKLSVLNVAIEFCLLRKNENEITNDISVVKQQNQSILNGLDAFFIRKSRSDEIRNHLAAQIREIKDQEEHIISSFSNRKLEEYKNLLHLNDNHLRTVAKLKQKIDETKRSTRAFEETQSLSTAKQARRKLLLELNSGYCEKEHLLRELQQMKGELCVKTVKNHKRDADALQNAKTILEEQKKEKEKELAEISHIIDSGKNDQLEKYTKREKQVNEYLQNFDQRIKDARDKIVQGKMNIETVLDYFLSKAGADNLEETSALRSKCKSLIADLKNVDKERKQTEKELTLAQKQFSEMKAEWETYSNVDSKLEKLTHENQVLEEKRKSLSTALAGFASDLEDAKERLNQLSFLLNENESYEEMRGHFNELENIEKQNEEILELIEKMGIDEESNLINQDIEILLENCNTKIINQLKNKNKRNSILHKTLI